VHLAAIYAAAFCAELFPSLANPILTPAIATSKGETMPKYQVLINDNAHFMDESERCYHGVFENTIDAIAACKAIVDDELNTMRKPGTTARELYELYIAFGPDPFVVPLNPNDPDVEFSAWTYAKEQCEFIVRLIH